MTKASYFAASASRPTDAASLPLMKSLDWSKLALGQLLREALGVALGAAGLRPMDAHNFPHGRSRCKRVAAAGCLQAVLPLRSVVANGASAASKATLSGLSQSHVRRFEHARPSNTLAAGTCRVK